MWSLCFLGGYSKHKARGLGARRGVWSGGSGQRPATFFLPGPKQQPPLAAAEEASTQVLGLSRKTEGAGGTLPAPETVFRKKLTAGLVSPAMAGEGH